MFVVIVIFVLILSCDNAHVYVLSRHTFQSDSTSLVYNYDINYADNVKYMTCGQFIHLCKVRKIDANILETIIK